MPFNNISSQQFKKVEDKVPNLGITDATIWVKLNIRNHSGIKDLFLMVEQPAIDKLCLYSVGKNGKWDVVCMGEYKKYAERIIDNPNYIFPLNLPADTSKVFYLSVSSKDQIQLPLLLGSEKPPY